MTNFYAKKDPSWAPILLDELKRREKWEGIAEQIERTDLSKIRKKDID